MNFTTTLSKEVLDLARAEEKIAVIIKRWMK